MTLARSTSPIEWNKEAENEIIFYQTKFKFQTGLSFSSRLGFDIFIYFVQQNNCISITPTWLTHSNLETPFGNNQEGAGEWVPIPIHHFLILNIRPNILDQLYNILFVERFVM